MRELLNMMVHVHGHVYQTFIANKRIFSIAQLKFINGNAIFHRFLLKSMKICVKLFFILGDPFQCLTIHHRFIILLINTFKLWITRASLANICFKHFPSLPFLFCNEVLPYYRIELLNILLLALFQLNMKLISFPYSSSMFY